MLRIFLFSVFVLTLPTTVGADIVQLNARTDTLDVGGFCIQPPDGVMVAPLTKDGKVDLFELPYQFVIRGDSVPAMRNIGVGIVVKLHDFSPGESLTIQADDHGAKPDIWRIGPDQDGTFWVGTTPDPGNGLLHGIYRFSVSRGRQIILIYELRVRSPTRTELAANPCNPLVS